MSFHSTLFSQTLSLISRHIFQKLEHRHKTGRSSRKFGSPAATAARGVSIDGVACDLPNMETLIMMYLNAEYIDSLDDSAAANST